MNTPALLIDIDAMERNVAAMVAFARKSGVALRPHAKTHKSVEIAKRQIAAGAVGVCCAKLGEAEALAEGGISDILITSPVVGVPGVERLVELSKRIPSLSSAVDHPDAVDALVATGQPLTLLVDIDPGIHRTGVASLEAAVELAQRIQAAPNLSFGGIQFYCGLQQHIESFAERRDAIVERTGYLSTIITALNAAGLPPPTITGGGTGTHAIDAELGVLTELQVGSYIFMDRQYADCEFSGGGDFEVALLIDARVISANQVFMATVDAGFKAFSTEAGPPTILAGVEPGSSYRFMGDEHGAVFPPAGRAAPRLGDIVTFGTPHCDPTVNLYDAYHLVRGDTVVDIWPIEGRGRGY